MNPRHLSKFLSLVLRHKPEALNIQLDKNGWADLDDLLAKLQAQGKNATQSDIEELVRTNNKQRFKLDLDNRRIRANQGHSITVDLEMQAIAPPALLYHGTATKNIPSIQQTGLQKRNRQHVHLSADKATAINVGSRHGKPIILVIDAAQMHADGLHFYQSENGVWLTDAVAVQYIDFG